MRCLLNPMVHVQLVRILESAEAGRYLDAMENATGLRGVPTAQGRSYAIEGDCSVAADRIVANLPAGWQDHLRLEL